MTTGGNGLKDGRGAILPLGDGRWGGIEADNPINGARTKASFEKCILTVCMARPLMAYETLKLALFGFVQIR